MRYYFTCTRMAVIKDSADGGGETVLLLRHWWEQKSVQLLRET